MARYIRSKARLRHTLNALFCYLTFLLTCMVAWMHMRPQTIPSQGDMIHHRIGLPAEEPSGKLLDSEDVTADVRREPAPRQNSTRTSARGSAVSSVQGTENKSKVWTASMTRQTEQSHSTKCKKTIASLTKYSKWFREKFKPKTKIFMDKDDTKNYKKWSSLILPFGFKGQKLQDVSKVLLHKNFTNPPVHRAGGKHGCIRCAVVGSGGILNGSGVGQEIDSHDYIFRLNQAYSSEKFAKDIGKRTTFYTFYPESQNVTRKKDKSVLAFYAMFKSPDVAYALKILNGEEYTFTRSKVNKNGSKSSDIDARKLKIIHPGFFYYIYHDFMNSKARPTTGALVILIAIHICDEVTVYGFGYDRRFTLHYYDKEFIKHKSSLTFPHNVENERKLWVKLHAEGVIKLFKRDL